MIIDCHTHVFPDKIAKRAMRALHAAHGVTPVVLPTVAGLLAHMDESGVDRAVLCPVATKPSQAGPINTWLLGQQNPRLIPFGAIHPHQLDAAAELERLEAAGVYGLKLQPFFQSFTLDDPRTRDLFDLIGDRFVVLLHGGDEIIPLHTIQPTPARLAQLLTDFPRLRLIVAHAGGYKLWDEVEEQLVGRNVLFDLSYTFGIAPDEQVRRIINCHGFERVLWGSDFPWQAESASLQGLRRLGLPEDQEEAILSGNFRRELPNA